MKPMARLLVALSLAGMMAGAPGVLSAAGRRGANVVVTRTDGVILAGELIVVRPTTIVVLTSSGADSAIAVADIASVRIQRKSRGGTGALVGFVVGAVAASAILKSSDWSTTHHDYFRAGFVMGLMGAAPGFLIGSLAGSDTIVKLAGQAPEKVRDNLAYLADRARVREKR